VSPTTPLPSLGCSHWTTGFERWNTRCIVRWSASNGSVSQMGLMASNKQKLPFVQF